MKRRRLSRRGDVPLGKCHCLPSPAGRRRGLGGLSPPLRGHVRMPKGLWCLGKLQHPAGLMGQRAFSSVEPHHGPGLPSASTHPPNRYFPLPQSAQVALPDELIAPCPRRGLPSASPESSDPSRARHKAVSQELSSLDEMMHEHCRPSARLRGAATGRQNLLPVSPLPPHQ